MEKLNASSNNGRLWIFWLLLTTSCVKAYIGSIQVRHCRCMAFLTSLHPSQTSEGEEQQCQRRQEQPSSFETTKESSIHRRTFIQSMGIVVSGIMSTKFVTPQLPVADAIGPTKLTLVPTSYSAVICPPNKPIPGQKAMVGMKGLCVTVYADLKEKSPKELEKVGVYGFITDGVTGDSVLANNPDLSTDSGQFAMIEKIKSTDQKIVFEFIAAVPMDRDLSIYENGIGPLNFESLRIISYPGGQQFGAISPCEMNEFSSECEEWEEVNGPYVKQEYMIKSNPRTKGQ
jgi:hypothetical protein